MRFISLVIGALAIFCSAVGCARHFAVRPSTSSESPTFTIVSAGQDHTCALTADGDVYCWGANADGQLGIGASDKLPHPKPLRVASGIKFKVVSAGYRHTCSTGERLDYSERNASSGLRQSSLRVSELRRDAHLRCKQDRECVLLGWKLARPTRQWLAGWRARAYLLSH